MSVEKNKVVRLHTFLKLQAMRSRTFVHVDRTIAQLPNVRTSCRLKMMEQMRVACKRHSSVNSGAWLRRFDDVTGVEKSCVAKGINRKKAKEKYFVIICPSPKHLIHICLRCLKVLHIHNCWNLLFVPKPLWNSDKQNWL